MQTITNHGGDAIRSNQNLGLYTFTALEDGGGIIETDSARTSSY